MTTEPDVPPLRGDILARLLLVQSTAGHLPDETSIIAFVCRGLEKVPGVDKVKNAVSQPDLQAADENEERYPLRFGGSDHGDVVLKLANRAMYIPYAPHVQNLLYVMGVMLEERRQRRLTEAHQQELERRVEERTHQLTLEVAERRAAENRALDAAKRAESYLEISEAIIVELDARGRIAVINKRGCDVLGYELEEIHNQDWFSFVIQDVNTQAMRSVFEQVMIRALPSVEYFENAVVTKTGELRHIAWHNRTRVENGVIVGTLSSGLDITERRRFETALASEKEQLAVTLRSIGDGVISTDSSGRVVAMNPVAEELTGWCEQLARGLPLEDVFVIIDERTQKRAENPVTQVLATQKVVELSNHIQLIAKDGTKRAIADSGAPIRNGENQTIGIVLVFRDVTEKYHLQEQIQRAERLDAIGVLAGGIAHDFNNLLSGIFGYISLARECATEGEPQAKALDEALHVSTRARDLTRQLLTFSKGGAPVRSVVDVRKLLADCTHFALSGSSVSCNLRFPTELPALAVDANQIWRVIDNLVRNAVQAMPKGGTLQITGTTTEIETHPVLKGGRYVELTISDDGPGIPREILPRIFDPFFTTKQQGSGLGLATAFSVVRKHDGYIDVASELGRGTTFRIYLPELNQGPLASANAPVRTVHRGAGNALVLDDEPYLCRLLERYLSCLGYRVTTVKDGEEAIEAAAAASQKGNPFVVALMDLTVRGGMGGKDAIGSIRAKCPALVAIASSGYSDDPVMAQPTEFGFTASLAKPFSLPELAAVLATHVSPTSQ